VFVNKKGGWLSQNDVYRDCFKPIVRRAGLPPIRPYDLRHTSATLLLSSGSSIRMVSDRLGHKDIKVTLKHYAHVLPCDQERAVLYLQAHFGDCHTVATRRPTSHTDRT